MIWEWYFYRWNYWWSSEFSIESDEILNNATALTSQFRIIPSGIDGNCLFHILNNIVFGGQLTAKGIRNEICDFIFKKKEIYRHICEGDLDNHLIRMKREWYWGTNLELLAFSDLMRLNINIYTSLDQDSPEFQINHPQNTGEINIFLKNWIHYEGLQLLDEQNEIQISNIEDLKKSNEVLAKPPQYMKRNIEMDNQQFVKENKKSIISQKMQQRIIFQIIIIIKKYLFFFTKNPEKDIQRD